MGTNFYWKKLPEELKGLQERYIKEKRELTELLHIGKRSAAGKYCVECGTTFCKNGTSRIHYDANPYPFGDPWREVAEKDFWYDKCPVCGKEGDVVCSFTWTFMKQKEIIKALASSTQFCDQKLIRDEYAEDFTVKEFWEKELANCPIEYQLAGFFG